MAETKIEWTDYTFNPWHGCVRVSPGCEHCYAETLSHRWGNDLWGPAKTTRRKLFGDKHWTGPEKWDASALKSGSTKKVFCGSMCDVFEQHDDVTRERQFLYILIEQTPHLVWQLLTKRPENIMKMVPEHWQDGFPGNVWMGTSAEDQKRLDERKSWLLLAPAVVRFLSLEPLLEPVAINFSSMVSDSLHWVIVGGESGPGKRRFNPDWARAIRDECKKNNVAFFMKQWDKVKQVPEDLMIREFPKFINQNL